MAKIKLKKRFKEKIPGGLASGEDVSSFDADSIKKGIEVELEHTSDIAIATEIAMDHLAEDPLYYDKLEKMEKGVNEMKLKIKKVLKEGQMAVDMDTQPGDVPPADFAGEPDYEGGMARNQMYEVYEYSKQLLDMIDDDMQLPAWVQSKLTKVADYIGAVKHFIEGEMALKEAESVLSNPEKADLDNDGELSSYEKKRGAAIEKAMGDDKKKDQKLDEAIGPKLSAGLQQIKKRIPQLDVKQLLANASKIMDAVRDLKKLDDGSLNESNKPLMLQFLKKHGLLIAGVSIVLSQMLGSPAEIPNELAFKMINMGLKGIDPLTFMRDLKGPEAIEFGFDIASGVFSESYILEGSCEDDGEMYEMELYSEECGCGALEEALEEAEYRGRKVPLNKPMRGDVKKFKVYVKDPKTGNVKKVNFGDPNMRIKKSNPKRRKSFRARHNCDNPGPKTKARYWSCRKWE